MGRVANWQAKEVMEVMGAALYANGEAVMERVKDAAKARCPVGTIVREGKWSGQRMISFTPRTGRNKGQRVSFTAKRVWMGRTPGDLKDTIRIVTRKEKGNIRVYAGTFKIFWAWMVERGTAKTAARPYLRPAFQAIKSRLLNDLKYGITGASQPVDVSSFRPFEGE